MARTQKRPAPADAADELGISDTKHVKIKHEEDDSNAVTPDNTSNLIPSEGIQDTAMPDANSTIKQEPMSGGSRDNNATQPSMDLIAKVTSNFQDTIESLSRHLAEKDQKIRDLETLVNQPGVVTHNNKHSVATKILDQISSSNRADAQPGASNINVPDSHSIELQDTRKHIEEQKAFIQEKDAAIQAYEAKIQEQDATIKEKDATIQEKDATTQEKNVTIQAHEATIQEQDITIQDLRQKWNEAESELDALKQQSSFKLASTEDIDDNLILEQFGILNGRIKNLTDLYFSGHPLTKNAKIENRILFNKITPEWVDEYLKNPCGKKYFIEALIWHRLSDSFLSRPLIIWSEASGKDMQQLHKTIWVSCQYQKLQTYHSLRVQAAEACLQIHGKNGHYLGDGDIAQENKAKLVNGLIELLKNYTHEAPRCRKEFEIIIDRAVDLAYSMAMAKAHYAVRLSNRLYGDTYHGFNLKPDSMRDLICADNQAGEVELIVSPALLKFGTSEGEDYSTSMTLIKAGVFTE